MSIGNAGDVRPSVVGGWEVLSYLGEGASAKVYKAQKDGKIAALKIYNELIIHRSGEQQQIARIERQLELVDHGHPNLVPILGGGRDENNVIYLVMGYIRGEPLNRAKASIPIERIRPILAQVAEAAHFLERKDLVHRDIKPANIVTDTAFRRAVLLDLGVLRPVEGLGFTSDHKAARPFVGTTRYSPPEFLLGQEGTSVEGFRAVTFYQLGAVLHDMITGAIMFQHVDDDNYPNLVSAVRDGHPQIRPEALRPDVPDALRVLANHCLDPNPESRLKNVTWEHFKCRRLARKPTVIFLYSGGTIGSDTSPDLGDERRLRKTDPRNERLLKAYDARLRRDYRQLTGAGEELPFAFRWKSLDRQSQLLSENADSDTWNAIARGVQEVLKDALPVGGPPGVPPRETRDGDYVLGAILLHGTDTLAYTAAALALSLVNLPCPIVVTGSNQPPNENTILERDLVLSKSDAWKNMLSSVLFLETFGHRFTEVFVCFGATVHNAVNLRKTALDRIPMRSEVEAEFLKEPYAYRNQSLQQQYMFRAIDGVYCNNFYPMRGGVSYDALINDRNDENKHVRQTPFGANRPLARSQFSAAVLSVGVTPIAMVPESIPEGTRVVILECYNSGTFPTVEGHKFTAFLARLMESSIPVALVARHGLVPSEEHYELQKIDGVELPVIRLFGIILETASPMLSIVVNEIKDSDWSPGSPGSHLELLHHRVEILKRAIRRWQINTPNILQAVLGNILDNVSQRQAITHELNKENLDYHGLVQGLFAEARGKAARSRGLTAITGDKPTTTFLRPHFLWTLLEYMRPFEVARSGPDGFSVLNEMGFTWGEQALRSLGPTRAREDYTSFSRLDAPLQDTLESRARGTVSGLCNILKKFGVAEVDGHLTLLPPQKALGETEWSLKLSVESKKHGRVLRDDERYAVIGTTKRERSFLNRLLEGCDLTLFDKECLNSVLEEYRKMQDLTWKARASALDWFLVGVFKAASCELLRELLIDPWIWRCSTSGERHRRALRQSVVVDVVLADNDLLRLDYHYRGRGIVELDPVSGDGEFP
ncbi:MAG TPA: asparaginase domain-containing protein [Thermoanaerobaculia bacterium]|jgi:serine/threonine protein kinase|nr:asparaginase domain-containing protein [Thermoanaerobaculia bacterium]